MKTKISLLKTPMMMNGMIKERKNITYALEIITKIKEIGSICVIVDDINDPSVDEILSQPWVDVWKCTPYNPNNDEFKHYKRLKRANEQ